MSAIDYVIEQDDPRFVQAIQEMGPLAAERFRQQFNMSCIVLTGVEQTIFNRMARAPYAFLAPFDNMSGSQH